MKKKNKTSVWMMAIAAVYTLSSPIISPIFAHLAQADDTVETKMKNKGEDAKADTKKSVRKAKKNVRKAEGTDTAGKDVQDSANNVKDDATAGKNKMENKLNQ